MDIVQLDSDLVTAMKAHDTLKIDVLRGLKTRLQNEKITKQRELEESEIAAVIRSEIKRRSDAVELYQKGDRAELAKKEQVEAELLKTYLPAELPEEEINKQLDELIAKGNLTQAQFGPAMAAAKQHFGDQASGGTISKLLKNKLK